MEIGRGGQICIGENKPTAFIANSMEGEKVLRSLAQSNRLFNDALLGGDEIAREEYESGRARSYG